MDLQALKTELERGHRTFKAFEQANEAVAALQGMEQNQKELQTAIDAKKKELAKLQQQIDDRQAAITKAETDAERITTDARQQAQKIIADANNQSAEDKAVADEALEETNDAIEVAKKELADVQAKIADRQSTLDTIEKNLAAHKEALTGALTNLR